MPSGLGNFIKQSHAPNPVGRRELDRRSNVDDLKIKRDLAQGAAQGLAPGVAPRRGFQPPQPPNGQGKIEEEDIFAGSVLEESEDTARDIDIGDDVRNHPAQHIGDRPVENIHTVENPPKKRHDDGRWNVGTNRDFGKDDAPRRDDRVHDVAQVQGRQFEQNFFYTTVPQADVVAQQFQDIKNGPAYSAAVKMYEARTVDTKTPFIGRFNIIPPPYPGQLSVGVGPNPTEQNGRMANGQMATLEYDGKPDRGEQGNSHGHVPGRQISLRRNKSGRDRLIAEMDHEGTDTEDVGSETDESTVLSIRSEPTPKVAEKIREHNLGKAKPSKKRPARIELDYDEAALSKMKYSELKDQPFESHGKAPLPVVPEHPRIPENSLDERLQYFAGQSSDLQHKLFAEMSMDQWEESGDWFLSRFGNIMAKLKDARKAKRDVSKAFEDELAVREETVRSKAQSIQDIMKQMRAGGEGVLRGRTQ